MEKELKSYNMIQWLLLPKFERAMHTIVICYKNKQRLHLNIGIVLDFETMTIEIEEDIDFKVCSDTQWFFMSKYERMIYLIKLAYVSKISCELDNGLVLNFETMTIEINGDINIHG